MNGDTTVTWTEEEHALLLTWFEKSGLAKKMENCPQNPVFHGEGSVLNHTRLVYKALPGLPLWQSCSAEDKKILAYAALLHDGGKPDVTCEQDGKIVSPHHSRAGIKPARRILMEQGLPGGMRETILKLIRQHMKPVYLLENENPEIAAIRLSYMADSRLLYLLTSADNQGRISEAIKEGGENIELWRTLCEETGCFETPYSFMNDQARVLFFRENLSSLHYVPYEDHGAKVHLVCGLPGAGKDYWIKNNLSGLPVVSLDDLREKLGIRPTGNQGKVISAAREMIKELLRNKQDLVINMTNTVKSTRARWLSLCAGYGAHIHIVYLEPSLPVLLTQNREREQAVPEKVLFKLIDALDVPSLTECHRLSLVYSC